ncbi:MAG: DUF4167 domain-containing protein [Novosphingobium sp.]
MNNNRGNNNRRRGRGNRQSNGGGQQLNRIDSRARGNAPQLLEKYRKLAQDAHLNGDRVQAEYYLQFADHYFRVIADQRVRQEEQRSRPQGERWQDDNAEGEDGGDFSSNSDFPSFDQPNYGRSQQREDRPRREEREEPREEAPVERIEEAAAEPEAEGSSFEPAENPFVRENRNRGGLRPRRDREERPRRDRDEPAGLDPASLPPAISAARDDDVVAAVEAEAKPRRGRPRKKPAGDDAGEALESVN